MNFHGKIYIININQKYLINYARKTNININDWLL